jgi:hypothetical protein
MGTQNTVHTGRKDLFEIPGIPDCYALRCVKKV